MVLASHPVRMTSTNLEAINLRDLPFDRFGTAIFPVDDMTPHSDKDAKLCFDDPNLRYYVMRLRSRPAVLTGMTRHRRATQCLGSADGQPWWLAVAAPDVEPSQLNRSTVQLVKVQQGEALQLHQNTWHAGPFFLAKNALFFNLELTDTNLTDHNFHRIEASMKLIMH